MKNIITQSLLISLALSAPATATDYWQQYLNSRTNDSDLRSTSTAITEDEILPNFSYAGYKFANQPIPDVNTLSYQSFSIVDYGAIANDGVSDKGAIRKAIKAAEDHIDAGGNGAIIQIPEGQFRINDASDIANMDLSDTPEGRANRKSFTIQISRGNIVLKGTGANSILYMDQNLELVYPTKDWTTPYILQAGYNTSNRDPRVIKSTKQAITSPTGDKFITTISSDHPRGSTKTVTVADSTLLTVGNWVLLTRLDDRQATINNAVSPYVPEVEWSAINNGLRSQEFHQIIAIKGNDITFASPIKHAVNNDGYWGLKHAAMLSDIGIEDVTLKGNWQGDFSHHKNGVHDGGWSMLRFNNVNNSWVKNVTFEDVNVGLTAANTAASTFTDVNFIGNPGHLSLDINSSTHVLAKNIHDTARHWHAAGFSHRAVGNVLSNSEHASDRYHNLHADQPYANLIDKNVGGWNYGLMGGSQGQQPNHLKYLVFWNNENTAPSNEIYNWSFMRHDSKYGRVIMPYVIGLSGWTFNRIESQQRYDANLPNTPQAHIQTTAPVESLYEAQLKQRHCSDGTIAKDLKGYWPLKTDLNDASCSSNNAVSYSANIGKFNGIDERIELGDFDTLNHIELDVKYDSWNTAKAGFVISKWNYGTNNPYYMQISKTGVLSARVNGKGISAGNLGDGAWHTISMSLSGTTLELFVDGISKGTTSVVVPASNDFPLSIGSTSKNVYPFIGEVANIKLY